MRQFIAARQMIDVAGCRTITALQILICFILFLIATARLSTAHTYIGLAFTSAMKMGLHTTASGAEFKTYELNMRTRVFSAILRSDLYVSAVLGLPPLIGDREIGAARERDRILINEDHRQSMTPPIHTAFQLEATAKHLDILIVVSDTIKTLYHSQPVVQKAAAKQVLIISNKTIDTLENNFRAWRASLESLFRRTDDDMEIIR